MAQIAKISQQVQLKCCGHKFYEFFKNKMECVFQMFPEICCSWKVLEGNEFSHVRVIHLKYVVGSPKEGKTKVTVDDANKSITFECVEGDVLRDFEVFQMKIEVVENGSNGSSANWSVEYVKANEDVAPPYNYLLCGAKVSKGLDEYLCNS
ncbi:major latex protein 146-like [Cucurbita maxima]|uniref:Major latex protein 146-like n=1 Tax=Cucurbita maxima TaxID=3661 RepID=A0A6J1J5M9_CUCMA|nr:major latex protein 146-like [Cucurbita maxima]